MPLILDQEGNEVEKVIGKPLVLSILDGNIVMTLTWEDGEQKTELLQEYLHLTNNECYTVNIMKKNGYTLVGDRRIGEDYPEYLKDFYNKNLHLFSGGQPKYRQRDEFKANTSGEIFSDRLKRELIFVRLNLPETISVTIKGEVMNFKRLVGKILTGIGLKNNNK